MKSGDQQELARHLGLSTRHIRTLEGEGIIKRLDGEPARYDLDANARRYQLYADRDMDAVCREIEDASTRVEGLFELLRMESNSQERRRVAQTQGDVIGRMEAAMNIGRALAPEHARDWAQSFTNIVVGRAVEELFYLCQWQRAEEIGVPPTR